MAKVPHIQEFPYLETDTRKKLDGFTVFSNGKTEDMSEENIGKRDLKSLESEQKYDFRKSLAWDSAFSTSSGILEVEDLFDSSNSWHIQNGCDMLGPEQDQHLSVNYLKPEIKTVTDEFNLRKSLAWDSAFFTSEGILNHEELSLLNKGPKKSEIDMFPRIEELWISSDSNCTIDSDGSSLASLEVSMHQSRVAPSTVALSSRNIQKVYSTKRMNGDGVSKLKVKSRPTSTMQTIKNNQPERTTKEQSVPPSSMFSAASGIPNLASHLKPPKISRRVRRSVPIAPTKRVPLFSNEVNGESKTFKPSGKCLTEKPNLFKTCSSDNNSSCTSLSWEFSSLSSQSCMNGSNGLCSPYRKLSTRQSSPEFSIVKNDTPNSNSSKHRTTNKITPEDCCHQTCSSVKKNCCCISPLVSIEGFSPASSMSESNSFHDDKGIMCSNPCSEVKGTHSVSFDASRNLKPSGLRMPSPKIGFFDVDNLLMSIENGGNKSHSKAFSKLQSGQKLKDVGITRTCAWKTRNSTISKTIKFSRGAVSKAEEGKDCLRNDEKIVNVMRAHEPELERQTCAKIDKRGVGSKILREREEQSCLKGKKLLLKEQTRANTIHTGNDQHPHTLHESEKENLIGFENELEQVRKHDVRGDVVIEFVDKNCQSEK
ncbi:hypothetical protein AAZX31_17G175100 [Glycine max]|nr:hypothetical protein JHK87_047703 [Glycine soja]